MRPNGNTVVEAMTCEAKVEEIRMNLRSELGDGKIFVVVEGEDDERAYQRLFDVNQVDFSVAGSCEHVVMTMKLACEDDELKNRVIGIKDADFDHLMGRCYPTIPNLFLTDTHDVETMMLTDYVMQCVCVEMMRHHDPGLREEALKVLLPYSYLKYYNRMKVVTELESDGLLFRGMKVTKVYDGVNRPSLHEWYNAVKAHGTNSTNALFPSEEDVVSFMDTNMTLDMLNLTCGHDVVSVMIKRMHTLCPQAKSKGEEAVASFIRVAYRLEEFRTTQLYKDICAWADARNLCLWPA